MKNKKNKNTILLLVILLAVTVGFALISTTLKIRGLGGVSGQIWDIHWDSNSVLVNQESTSTQEPTVSQDELTVSYNVELELPGDFYEFTIDAVNEGTIDGMVAVESITPVITDDNDQPATLPEYINYSVTYDDGEEIEQYQLLRKRVDASTPTREKIKVRIEYDEEATTVPEEDLTYKIDVEIPYTQANNNAKDRKNLYLYDHGNEYINKTGGWMIGNGQSNGRSDKLSDSIRLYNVSYLYCESHMVTTNQINISDYSKMHIEYKINDITNYDYGCLNYYIGSTEGRSPYTAVGDHTDEFDISTLSDNPIYIWNCACDMNVYKVWLTKE